MRKGLFFCSLVVITGLTEAAAQNTNAYPGNTPVNYLRTWEAAAPEENGTALVTRPVRDVKQATKYFDGLGRLVQTVLKQASLETGGAATDLVSPVVYDVVGREQYKYLPFAANNTANNASVNDGAFKLNPFQQQQSFMTAQYGTQGETVFYGKTNYESSSLNRVEKTMPPGNNWAGSGRGMEMKYWVNTNADNVMMWKCENSPGSFGVYSVMGPYGEGQLFKNVLTDEHGKQVIEFKDKEGRIVLKKVQLTGPPDDGTGIPTSGGGGAWLCTCYIYDDLGNLRCVIQPEGVKAMAAEGWPVNGQLSPIILDEQCFRYEYDERNRMSMKKVPGAGEIYMVYDALDRLVMMQDANMRNSGNWMVTKYDGMNRPVETGLWINNNSLSFHQANAAGSSNYPLTSSSYEQLTITHYDDYAGLPAGLSDYLNTWNSYFSNTDNNNWPYPQMPQKSTATKGLATWMQTRILGTTSFINTVTYYDEKSRPVQVQSTNISGGTDVNTTQYNWAGQPLMAIQKQEMSSENTQEHIVITKMTYDDMGRVLQVRKIVNSNISGAAVNKPEQLILTNKYDKLGQLKGKQLGAGSGTPLWGAGGLLNYEYNIRGWLLGMNRDYARDAAPPSGTGGPFFGFDLGYDKANNNLIGGQTYNNPQYNGNIGGMVWKSKGDGEKRKYDFNYDAANRLMKADFSQYTGSAFNQTAGVNFSMKMGDGITAGTAYDDNGNIKQMQQWGLKLTGSVQIDNLGYLYQQGSSKLARVTDVIATDNGLGDFKDGDNSGTDDYSYDANGNLVMDRNKKILGIQYNHLNLPEVITVEDPAASPPYSTRSITYTYDATGNKLKKIVAEHPALDNWTTTTTTYINGFVYESKSQGGGNPVSYTNVLQFTGHEEGRIRLSSLPSGGLGWAYDYMLKDHLGNVRMILTEEQQQDKYPVASLEDAKRSTEEQYYTIDNTKIEQATNVSGLPAYTNDNGIGNNPADAAFSAGNSQKLYKLSSNTNKTGLGITLKVMAGDKIDIWGKSYYFQNNTGGNAANAAIPVLELLSGLMGTPGGAIAGAHTTAAELNAISGITNPLSTTYLGDPGRNDAGYPLRPRAFINYIFFDEQFKMVEGGFSPVNNSPGLKDHFSELQNRAVQKNGYVYIYVSNESPVNVFFDNLQVVHTKGPLVEETHYYPFGLTMKGISSKAYVNGFPENRLKFVSQPFDSEFDLNWYQFRYRNYDPQIARFIQIDPLAAQYVHNTTYAYAENKPINGIDLEGLEWLPINEDGQAVKPDDKENINGYKWVGYDTDEKTGKKTAKKGTVANAYTFGIEGRTTLGTDNDGNATEKWESYSDISTGDAASDKKISTLHPSIQNKVKAFILKTDNRFGIKLRVTDGFRTIAQQNALYAKGRRGIKGEATVTGAKGGQSNHNYGLAIDVVPIENGEINYGSAQYPLLGRIGESVGLNWGGRFRSVDMPHFEDFRGYSIKQLRVMPKDEKGLPVLPK
ncbi:MAG: DUF6443 domain-containing protein [Chitinophagaceae bacterium]